MNFLHSMIRIRDVDASLHFFCELLGLQEVRRRDSERGRYTLIFLAAPGDPEDRPATIELTHNWDVEDYGNARNFGHLAFAVEDIYAVCARLREGGVTILRPPRDGRMAFVKSPDDISVELLQRGEALEPAEPWSSMENTGSW